MMDSKGLLELQVISGSMEPVIMTNEKIIAVRLEKHSTTLKPFDIIVFWDGNRLICHYIWHINRLIRSNGVQVYVTRPYAGKGEDLPLTEAQVLGLVTSHRISSFGRLKLLIKAFLKK